MTKAAFVCPFVVFDYQLHIKRPGNIQKPTNSEEYVMLLVEWVKFSGNVRVNGSAVVPP